MALLLSPLHAQLKTYLTIEAGPHWSIIKVSDPGNYFKTALPNSTIAGFTIEQEFIKNLSLAAGLYYQPYKTGIRMDISSAIIEITTRSSIKVKPLFFCIDSLSIILN